MKLTIIGGGPGGYETAVEAVRRGVDVTLVTEGPLGGTCLNEGCIPTKALCRAAALVDEIRSAGEFGIEASCSIDFQKVMARKDAVVAQLQQGIELLLKKVQVIRGKASLKDGHTVVVNGQELVSDAILLATGSLSASLPIEGAEYCVSSTEMLSLSEPPKRLAVIGGGVIGLEFASLYRSFCSEVTVLEFCKTILPRFDEDIAKRLKQSLSKRGISIETSASVQAVVRKGDAYEVRYQQKDESFSVEADLVLMAVGRRPNLGSLNLDEMGIAYTRHGVSVNSYMQTSIPSVYAVGDLTGGMMLAHAATFQGRRALNHLLAGQPAEGAVDKIDLSVIPAAVFTVPEAAMVGLTEADCSGRSICCLKSFFRANGKAVAMGETDGICKLIVDKESGRILGCHLFGPHSADLVQEVSALMTKKATLEEFQAVIHAHPTLGEVVQAAANA